ncbi:F-box/kelch-repeat protein At3g06240-like [Papaver somniferum]|uniref:F-box/kelch-repeat protein At3g06240-like n=1 Tax=Papaver somniferum TaxID=3469 RepID=UPI000E6FB099|nr:F-box/kelch-repeat protein At3g06240-like [Papaver somniferum]
MELKKKEGSYFPEEILEEIFFRLPRKSLLRFKCLSKLFYTLIGSRNFQNRHRELLNLKDNPWVDLYDDYKKSNRWYTVDYKSVSSLLPLLASSSSEATMSCDCHVFADRVMDYPSVFQDYDKVKNWSSYRDLHWISTTKGSCEEFYIWNSVTQGCEKIPMTREVKIKNLDGYGFGYDNKTDDYKLVMVAANWATKCSDVEVYTLGTKSWRRIESIPYSLDYPRYYLEGVKFNGALHWLAHAFEEGYVYTKLVSFDIVHEKFEELALPEAPMPYLEEPLEDNTFNMRLGVFEGCLCLVFHVFSIRVDVWMMQEYGVRESWVKCFASCLENLTTSKQSRLLWYYFKNSETLWKDYNCGDLVLYDPNNKIFRKLILDSDSAKGEL